MAWIYQVQPDLSDEQFERWSRPELVVPAPYDLEAPAPEIFEGVYGQCVLTGKPLVAFGVICVKRAAGSDSELRLTTHWTPFRAAAESLLSEAVQALESARSETVPDLPAPGKLQTP